MKGLTKSAQVDGYQQETDWSCSAATLKAVLDHHGENIPEKAVIEAIGAREGRGAETTDIVQGARKLGFEAWEGSFPSLEAAHQVLASDLPIIADVQSFNYPGKGHYVIIAGFKPGKGYILMDPNTKGKTTIPNWRVVSPEELEEIWWDKAMAPPHELMPKWGVVVAPKMEKTATYPYGKALRRAKAESARARDYNKYGGDVLPSSDRDLATVETHVRKHAGRVQLEAFFEELEKVALSGSTKRILGYVAAGAGLGGASGLASGERNKPKKEMIQDAVLGALKGMAAGAYLGYHLPRPRGRARATGGPVRPKETQYPDWLKDVSTKAEAKKRYHSVMRKHHPDLGGDEETAKKLIRLWEEVQVHPDFPKTAATSFNDFFLELEKMAGAEASNIALTAAKILGGGGALHGVATREKDEGVLGSAAGGGVKGALLGALLGIGLGRRVEGKTTIPHPKSWSHKASPGTLRKILRKLV